MGRVEKPAILIIIVCYPFQGSSRSAWEWAPGGAHVCLKCASEFSSYANMREYFRSCVERVTTLTMSGSTNVRNVHT